MSSQDASSVTIQSDGTILLKALEGEVKKASLTTPTITPATTKRYTTSWRNILLLPIIPFAMLLRSCVQFFKKVMAVLQRPVISKSKKTKRYISRLELFIRDVVSFGFTFVVLFSCIFAVLNYQSILQIIKSHTVPAYEAYEPLFTPALLDNSLVNKPTIGDTLSFLPATGPPDNWIVIPSLQLKAPITIPSSASLISQDWDRLEEDIQLALEQGVAHYPGTAVPGQAGNFFVTGHSSYYPWADGDYKSIFALLPQLQIGEEYFIYYNGNKHRYRVTDKKEVQPTDVSVLNQPPNKRVATLMTCTPIGTTLRRLIVSAEEIDPITGEPLEVGEQSQRPLPSIGVSQLPI